MHIFQSKNIESFYHYTCIQICSDVDIPNFQFIVASNLQTNFTVALKNLLKAWLQIVSNADLSLTSNVHDVVSTILELKIILSKRERKCKPCQV